MSLKTRVILAVCFVALMSGLAICFAVTAESPALQTQPVITPLEEKPIETTVETKTVVAEVNLPPDSSPRLNVKEVRIAGNTLIATELLLEGMPEIYNSSKEPIEKAPANAVFDLRILKDIVINPGQAREVSTRSIQGFTQYILSVYQGRHYAGVYVYVPAKALDGGKLKDEILPVQVLEAKISDVQVKYYDVNGIESEKGRLRLSKLRGWSPVWAGEVTNKKKLDDYINLLNLNPDRRIYATVSPGIEPNMLTLKYDVYEANPWHYFIQLDNAGTKDRRWSPRLGAINTNLFGFDDKLTGVVQGKPERGIEDNYAAYASYDFPIFTPRLRLNVFGARSEFDIAAAQGIDFLGKGSSYGGTLRFNALQANGWFFDVLGSLRHDKSKYTPSIFPQFLGSDLSIDLWGLGVDVHRSNDISSTSLSLTRYERMDGSGDAAFNKARTGANPNFHIVTLSAAHQQYIDSCKIQRMLGSFTYIVPSTRLVPVEMTSFGGLYTVRGYKESEIVADGGIIASLQYEYDLVKASDIKQSDKQQAPTKKNQLRKLAPVGFFDFGRAIIHDTVAGEEGTQELCSLGVGLISEIGDHFSSGLYYGWPLRDTEETNTGEGRLSVNLMMRW